MIDFATDYVPGDRVTHRASPAVPVDFTGVVVASQFGPGDSLIDVRDDETGNVATVYRMNLDRKKLPTCDGCHRGFQPDDLTAVSGDTEVCKPCLERSYRQCEVCDEYWVRFEVREGTCPDCVDSD